MSERTPLLHYRLSTSVNEQSGEHHACLSGETVEQSLAFSRLKSAHQSRPKKLSTFFGVVIPTLLSMFSVVVFLRIGFVVGQCGLYQAIAMFLVAYFIISMTVLSVCAISTNGALDAGGAYYMISRALGPEFGGSLGVMFFLANVCSSALYILGLVEAIVATFGLPEDGVSPAGSLQVLPAGYWWSLLYATGILLLCLLVCLVGAEIYAKASFLIFLVVMIVLASIFISFFAMRPRTILLPAALPVHNNTGPQPPNMANFTGFKLDTLLGNLDADYAVDYTTGTMMSFATVFAVMFNGCTGIMAGSNMSGDLKNPSYSIPRGTITAVIFTFIIYNLLSLMVACSCDRILLQRDYSFLRDINVWNPLVTVGVYSSTMSAAMSNLIGASRILFALARDDLFGTVLSPAKKTSHNGNPWVSVLLSWFLVQLVVFTGKLNTIASIVTIFFLLVYAAVDLACLALEWASAPNFRPTFRYFTWHTCVLGIVGCAIMMFLINAIYASASIAFMLLLLLLIHYLSPTSSWGYISQALIFHQVRKYLLMLDVRKDHVKFWRPQLLLMVSNPRSSVGLITFINDIKKSGLYVLGHVQLGDLGGMRPNTLVLGFYDDCTPKDKLTDPALTATVPTQDPEDERPPYHFPALRPSNDGMGENGKVMGPHEYVAVIADAMKMMKNVALARYFHQFDRASTISSSPGKGALYVDVWPVNLLRPDSSSYVDTCSLFLLQLACVLNMVRAWRHARLRLFLCVEEGRSLRGSEEKLGQLLKELRIKANVYTVPWDQQVALHWQRQGEAGKRRPTHQSQREEGLGKRGLFEEKEGGDGDYVNSFPSNATRLSDEYLLAVNRLILDQACPPPAVRFLYLPHPPADTQLYTAYLRQLDLLTEDLGPTLLIHGVTPVLTTDL
uniref:Solute carrier family 12 member 9 n=1 Tax=Oncorhynchus tshawytscha TaxID=74940 RepID=A0A8C8IGW6_ONCTS